MPTLKLTALPRPCNRATKAHLEDHAARVVATVRLRNNRTCWLGAAHLELVVTRRGIVSISSGLQAPERKVSPGKTESRKSLAS